MLYGTYAISIISDYKVFEELVPMIGNQFDRQHVFLIAYIRTLNQLLGLKTSDAQKERRQTMVEGF